MDIRHKSEQEFANYLIKNNIDFIFQPQYNLFADIGYTPDFYSPSLNVFYEVVGSRQAFSQNKAKILLAMELSNLEIVKPNGDKYNYNVGKPISDRKITPHPIFPKSLHQSLGFMDFDFRQFAYDNRGDVNFIDAKALALALETTTSTIYNYLNNGKIKKSVYHKMIKLGFKDLEKYIKN